MNSPSAMSSESPRTASTAPNRLSTSTNRIAGHYPFTAPESIPRMKCR